MSHETRKAILPNAVPTELYEEARRRLLSNGPMLAEAGQGASASALTVGEAEALESVGLSTAKWADDAGRDPLMRSIAD